MTEMTTNSFLVTNFHTDEMLRHKGPSINDVRNNFGIFPFLRISFSLPVLFVLGPLHPPKCGRHLCIIPKLIDFIIHFMEEIDKEVSEMKLAINSRARICAESFLKEFRSKGI